MSKKASTVRRRNQSLADISLPDYQDLTTAKTKKKPFKPLNESQKDYVNKIYHNTITFGIGPAGTGKSHCAAAVAAQMFQDKQIERIILTRPVVEAGEELGFLPGELNDKYLPYVTPIIECLSKSLGRSHVEALIQNERIVMLPLAYMRGYSFNDSFVILDEAQNVSRVQMKLFLTRIGKNTTVVVDGDTSQRDIQVDGLDDAVRRLAPVPSVAVHRFTTDDIVRSGIVTNIIKAYSDEYEDDMEGLNRYLKT